jgi:hypothetical protein
MRRLIPSGLAAILVLLPLGCRTSAKPSAAPKESSMASTKTVHPDVLKRFCGQPPGPAPERVRVLKDSAGNIGGYLHVVQIPDSPIYYLDAEGRDYALFHIYGTDEEKAKNQPLIDKLRKAYPIEEPLNCP